MVSVAYDGLVVVSFVSRQLHAFPEMFCFSVL